MDLWLSIWLYVSAALAVVDFAMLVKHWNEWDALKRLAPLAVIALVLHVWEEWRIPGGFWYLYNGGVANYPMSQLTDMLTNFIGIALGTIVVFWGANSITSIVMLAISAMEVAVHCVILRGKSAALYGISYNPGMITAIGCFLPLAVLFLVFLIKKKPRLRDILLGIVFAVIVNVACVVLPEALFADPASPYAFTDPGFYSFLVE